MDAAVELGRNPVVSTRFSLRSFLARKIFQEILGLEGSKNSWDKKRFLRGNFAEKFPRPKFPQEKKLEYSQQRKFSSPTFPGDKRKFYEEILRGNFRIT